MNAETTQAPPRRKPVVYVVATIVSAAILAPFIIWTVIVPAGVNPPPLVKPADGDAKLAEALRGGRSAAMQQLRSAEGWGDYGRLLYVSGYRAEARICLTQAERFDPAEPRWPYLLGMTFLPNDPGGDVLAPRRIEGLEPATGPPIPDEPAAAIPHLRRAVKLADERDPDNAGPRLRLGQALWRTGQLDEAAGELEKALAKVPNDPVIHLALARVAVAKGDRAAALAHLDFCTVSPFARQQAAELLQQIGGAPGNARSPDQPWFDPYLIECQRKALHKPGRLREARALITDGKHMQAARILGVILQETPDSAAYVEFSRCLLHLGDHLGAEQAAKTGLTLSKLSAPAHLQWAEVHSAAAAAAKTRKRFEEAAEASRAAVQMQPDSARARELLALAHTGLGERDEAIDELHEAVRLNPDSADVRLLLGELLAEAGQLDEARLALQEAVRLGGPNSTRAKAALEKLGTKKGGK